MEIFKNFNKIKNNNKSSKPSNGKRVDAGGVCVKIKV